MLELVARELPGPVFGPLNGSVPAAGRQQEVDRFSAARPGAVLVAQAEALGAGLNIRSASVVVLCEPRLKPTTEAQATARAHRMGRVRSVQVHRPLSELDAAVPVRSLRWVGSCASGCSTTVRGSLI